MHAMRCVATEGRSFSCSRLYSSSAPRTSSQNVLTTTRGPGGALAGRQIVGNHRRPLIERDAWASRLILFFLTRMHADQCEQRRTELDPSGCSSSGACCLPGMAWHASGRQEGRHDSIHPVPCLYIEYFENFKFASFRRLAIAHGNEFDSAADGGLLDEVAQIELLHGIIYTFPAYTYIELNRGMSTYYTQTHGYLLYECDPHQLDRRE